MLTEGVSCSVAVSSKSSGVRGSFTTFLLVVFLLGWAALAVVDGLLGFSTAALAGAGFFPAAAVLFFATVSSALVDLLVFGRAGAAALPAVVALALAVDGFAAGVCFSFVDFELLERTILNISLVGRQADLWFGTD
jgi:hypothetical protein